MIAWLEGRLREKLPTHVVLDVGGVGYALSISLHTFDRLPDGGTAGATGAGTSGEKTVALHVRTIVREDAIQLYGFTTRVERSAFDLLLKANRVGPKLAQAILSGIEPERLLRALQLGDSKVLRQVPGIGAKMAERMAVELRDGAAELLAQAWPEGEAALHETGEGEAEEDVREQLLSALLNLGYPRAQAERVVGASAEEAGEGASIQALIRVALRRLAR